ncbi:MAG: hypothetical protein CMD52_02800 [Gammaproteobacteria bacterium]|nr:hypothetical protein [Gammaproteobacteria bacterium]|tara:strand:+ start:272 stop:1240 length:969 start_codon:yes stop_codon:yes gene_type:complete
MDFIPSSGPHLHIVLNHLPVYGTFIALGLFLYAINWKSWLSSNVEVISKDIEKVSLVLFVLLGILSIPTYISGAAARWSYQGRSDTSMDVILAHQDAALMAFLFLGLAGCMAWLALWQRRRFSRAHSWGLQATLVFSVLSVFYLFKTGSVGGTIVRPGLHDAAGTAEGSGIVEFVESTIQSFIWAWPSMEAVHFIGMALVFGSVTVMGLRVLGVAKSVPFSAMHRLLPLGALGLLVNVITGVFFFIADSGRYVAMDGFPPKIIWLVIGAVAILYFTIFDEIWKVKSGEDAPITAKLMAVLTILSWGCVLVFGRLLPYYGDGG